MKLITKRAFTLIELLAVIIVLAIVALVATPIVLDVISEAKMSSLKSRYYSNIDIFRQYYANNYFSGNYSDKTFTCENNICRNDKNEDKLELDIEQGLVTIEENGKVNVDYMVIDGYLFQGDIDNLTTDKLYEETSNNGSLIINQNNNLFNLKIYGNSVQEGTPTPEAPIEIKSVGEKTKNLFNNLTIDDNTKLSYGNPTSSDDRYTSSYIDCENISTISINLGASFAWYDADKNIVSYENKSVTMFRTYTKPEGAKYLRVDFDKSVITSDQVMIVDGKYTADTMPEYEPYGKYKVPVEVSGKNLFDKSSSPVYSNHNKVTIEETATGIKLTNPAINSSAPFYATIYKIETVEKIGSQTVNITFDAKLNGVPSGRVILGYVDETGTNRTTSKEVKLTEDGRYTVSLTVDPITYSGQYLGLWFYSVSSNEPVVLDAGTSVEYSNVMLSIGENEYEPYMEPKTYNIFINEPLRKVGDVSDYIDLKTGQVIRQNFEYVFTGEETWNNPINELTNTIRSYVPKIVPRVAQTFTGYSEKCIFDGKSTSSGSGDEACCQYVNNTTAGDFYVRILKIYCADPENPQASDFKNIYSKGTKIYGILETPSSEAIEVPNIKSSGTSTIKINTTIKPSNLVMQYYENKGI